MIQPSVMTLAYAQEQLGHWMAALQAASTGSSYSVEGQTVTRQDIPRIREEIQRWHNTVATVQARGQGKTRAMGSQVAFPAPGGGSGGIIPQSLWTDYRT